MLISIKRKFIFVHIYKNAGSSITNALMPFASNKWQRITSRALKNFNISPRFRLQSFPDHIKASELINIMGKEAFETFFSFAIIRNPWDGKSLYINTC
ncbi:sulfotransferase family protein [Gammaproteobacteria bacterium]|nr:sulfotransferase family protein [Gammaproteobacteria bacterium]